MSHQKTLTVYDDDAGIRRFNVLAHGLPATLQDDADGKFVLASDYDNLRADRDRYSDMLDISQGVVRELRARIAELEAQIAEPAASRALEMLTSAALDHYTPHMVCVPSTAWSEAMRVANAAPVANRQERGE